MRKADEVLVLNVRKTEGQRREKRAHERTCVGCGQRDDASALVRLVVEGDGTSEAPPRRGQHQDGTSEAPPRRGLHEVVAFDLAGSAFGRGAHVHARPECLAKAPRGIARAFHRAPVPAHELGRALVEACDRSMSGLLVAARRLGAIAAGADAATAAVEQGWPLLVVAVDAGAIAGRREVQAAVAGGRAVAWKTKTELGGLLGAEAVALCAVRHEGIAERFKSLRAAADAGATVIREGEGCSTRPEAR